MTGDEQDEGDDTTRYVTMGFSLLKVMTGTDE